MLNNTIDIQDLSDELFHLQDSLEDVKLVLQQVAYGYFGKEYKTQKDNEINILCNFEENGRMARIANNLLLGALETTSKIKESIERSQING